MEEILKYSNKPERWCRFAIDEQKEQLVVMRDQIDFSGKSEFRFSRTCSYSC